MDFQIAWAKNSLNRVVKVKSLSNSTNSLSIDKIKQRAIGYEFVLRGILGFKSVKKNVKLLIRDRTHFFEVRNISDFSILYDLFVMNEYESAKQIDNVHHIVDLGSNVGASLVYFKSLFPKASVSCYEPDSLNLEQLMVNSYQYPEVEVHHCAVGDHDGLIAFFQNEKKGVSSSIFNRNKTDKKVEIPMISFDTMLDSQNGKKIDLLKFDIEGAEYSLFKNTRRLDEIPYYIGEIHTDLMNCSKKEFCRLFKNFEVHTRKIGKKRHSFFAELKT